tara:strand:+ start:425 stop:751 length:327 start_codon:yes stop_codon:yes gene_type:complete
MLILVSNNSFINSIEKISTEKVISAIENNNYSYIEEILDKRLIGRNDLFNGKTLIIHAVINDNGEMINLLVRKGCSLQVTCEEGYLPIEWAEKLNKIYALAEIIVISA